MPLANLHQATGQWGALFLGPTTVQPKEGRTPVDRFHDTHATDTHPLVAAPTAEGDKVLQLLF